MTDRNRPKLDHANQAALIHLLAGRWAWCKELGWLHFDGRRWRERPTECVRDEIAEHYRRFVDAEERRIVNAAGGWSNVSNDNQQYLTAVKRLLGKSYLDAVTSMAGPKPGVLVEATAFDAHPDLLNCANGIVDLRTGELRPHDPALLMRKITPVAYRPEALDDPDLAHLLECIPDEETRDWLQLRFGQAATGYVPPDDLLLLLHGGGENGKSTLVGTVEKALGEYAVAVDDKVLLDESGAHSTERMDLFGARFGLTEEIPGGRELSMNKVKKIVGTPVLIARRMRCDPVEWEPTHALFVTTNTAPIVKSTDHGAWRRLAKVSFPIRYRKPGEPLEGPNDRPGDPGLSARMTPGTARCWRRCWPG